MASSKEAINLIEDTVLEIDSEDEDLRRAIALSLQDTVKRLSPVKEITQTSSLNGGLLGIDRKAMEQERLARLKRKRGEEISPPPLTRRLKLLSTISKPQIYTPQMSSSVAAAAAAAVPPPSTDLKYSTPRILQTYSSTHPRSPNGTDTTLSELLQAPLLQSAVLSSFIWSFDWLLPHFNTKTTKFLLVMHAKTPDQRRSIEQDFSGIPNVRLCFPNMKGQIQCMHSKLMLLFFSSYMRVVIPTANLVPFDWGEDGGVMENTVFVVDLPRLSDPERKTSTSFYENLVDFVRAQNFPNDVIVKLDDFDWASTQKFGFVHSIGGAHVGNAWRLTGLCGLGRTVASLGLQTMQTIQLDFVTSSIGSLNDEFMRSIYLAAQGDDGLRDYHLRVLTTTKLPKKARDKDAIEQWKDNFRFYFPSADTVQASKGGPRKAGTICFSEKWWQGPKFPRANIRDCVSRREKLLMHNKIIFARFEDPIIAADGEKYRGWAYVGSANLSESAWGRLVQDKATNSQKLNCRNWECGAVVPVSEKSVRNANGNVGEGQAGLSVFDPVVPVPMKFPGKAYVQQRPWFFGS